MWSIRKGLARQEDICRVYTVKGDNMGKKKNDLEKKLSGTMSEFKAFILKGNIIDMAVGVIIGGAFSKIVTSLVNDILMPLLGAVTGGASFNEYKYVIHSAVLDEAQNVVTPEVAVLYGSFIQNIIDFLIVGLCMFFMVKAVAMVTSKFHHEEEKKEEPAPAGPTTEELLAEIRDLLKNEKQM